jgi:4-hydroxy-tetrahydrodipicolinate synthase
MEIPLPSVHQVLDHGCIRSLSNFRIQSQVGKIMLKLQGVLSVLPTPFAPNGDLDLESLRKVIRAFLAAGVNGFTALGVTSEVSRLTENERKRIIETVITEINGRVPVVVGTTAEGTQICVENTRIAADAGAAAVMVSPPRMPKLNSDAVVRHFKTLADAVDIPIVVQDYPPISGYSMEPALLLRILREVPRAIAIKLEDAPTPLKVARLRALAEGTSFAILGGLGGMYLFEELLAGADGAMTGFSFPEILIEVIREFHAGNLETAKDTFYRYVGIMRFEFQEGLGMAIRKEILRRRGMIENAAIREPGAKMDTSTSRALDELLAWYRKEGCPWI